MPRMHDRPGIFWTWQAPQVEDASLRDTALQDMAEAGFGTVLVQPRGCPYGAQDDPFVAAVAHASARARHHGVGLWVHLDPRSMARPLIQASGESAEYLVVAGTSPGLASLSRSQRPLDVEVPVHPDGSFGIRLDYPANRPYHVHSDGAIVFRPVRLERCLAYRRDASGSVARATVEDVTASAHLFTNELEGYVEVFGTLRGRAGEGLHVLALVAFASNYPDYAGPSTRARMGELIDRYAASGARLDGIWWDEPGYCTGFDRTFRNDRGRLPWGHSLARLHRERTGREPLDDVLYLLRETDDGLWGSRREAYYRTLEAAVFGAQADLLAHARRVFGPEMRAGVHHTWHQNADDVINGCMDWWRGAAVLGAGFADAGDADRVDDAREMAEVTALATVAVSLGRHAERSEAHYNLWGVNYGEERTHPGPDVVDWWVDLQATLGCTWLAHTYGPTGYFERPSVWGPGYPDHPTWARMKEATDRLTRVAHLAQGRLPRADVALVYPLGTFFRMASDLANPLAQGCHDLIATLVRAGYELDVVSAEVLCGMPADRYRAILFLHPFGGSDADVAHLAACRRAGTHVVAAGLPPVAGDGYAGARVWEDGLGLCLPEASWPSLVDASASEAVAIAGRRASYRGRPHWGRPLWTGDGSPREVAIRAPEGIDASPGATGSAAYLGLLLEGLGDGAPAHLADVAVPAGWSVPAGCLSSRTDLPGGGTLIRLCPSRYGHSFAGTVRSETWTIEVEHGDGLVCVRLDAEDEIVDVMAPEGTRAALARPGRGA